VNFKRIFVDSMIQAAIDMAQQAGQKGYGPPGTKPKKTKKKKAKKKEKK